MKKIVVLLSLFLLYIFSGCEKQETTNIEVDTYVELLEKGSYEASDLPAFTTEDISALLEYRNDTSLITNFPHNPISSFWLDECRLGTFILWTIESVRAVEIQSEFLIGRFPSQNSILFYRDSTLSSIPFDLNVLNVAAQAYFDWWYSDLPLADKMNIDPLEDTDFRWY